MQEVLTLRQLWYDDAYEILFLSQSPLSITIEITGPSFMKKEFVICKKESMLLQAGHYRRLKFASNFNAYKVDWSSYSCNEEF